MVRDNVYDGEIGVGAVFAPAAGIVVVVFTVLFRRTL